MIKKLFFVALLLLTPGLAYGLASITLPGQVVPGSSVPAPAAAAGFMTPVLNIDFTSVAGNWPAHNIVQCGASPSVSGQPSTWVFQSFNIPCPQIVNDGGTNALLVQAAAGTPGKAGISWPGLSDVGSPPNTWMPNAFYGRFTFHVDTPTLVQGGTNNWGDVEWWSTAGSCCLTTNLDENMGEATNNSVGQGSGTDTLGGGFWEWTPEGCNPSLRQCNIFGNTFGVNWNLTVYHTIEVLWTTDGSSKVAVCSWLDANGNYNGSAFQGCSSGSLVNSVNYVEHDRVINFDMGEFGGGARASTSNGWIQNYQIWSCPNFISTVCAGAVVDHWPFP